MPSAKATFRRTQSLFQKDALANMEQRSIDQLARILDENIDELPQTLQVIVELIGPQTTAKLVGVYGGLRFYVPGKASADHPIAELIGFDNMRTLCDEYRYERGGTRLALPSARALLTADMHKRIRAHYGRKSARELAKEHHLSERQVERIVAKGNGSSSPAPTKAKRTSLTSLPWPGHAPTSWVNDGVSRSEPDSTRPDQ